MDCDETNARSGSRLVGRGVSVSRSHMSLLTKWGGGNDTCVVILTEGLILAGC